MNVVNATVPSDIVIPTDYVDGYPLAREVDAARADTYLRHTTIGDPLADAMVDALAPYGHKESARLIALGMERDDEGLKDGPEALRTFFDEINKVPDWVDFEAFNPGIRMFHRSPGMVIAALLGGVLIEGFSTNIARSFFITGRLRESGNRRLRQNNRHMSEIFLPGGLERFGDGWKLSVRLRLVHAQVRRLLKHSDDWDEEAWGTPLSAAHMGFAIAAFSARKLKHLKNLGVRFNQEERGGLMAVWRYTGHLMGIPQTILYRDEADALDLFEIGSLCEPEPSLESIALANSLINSAPIVAGFTESQARQDFANYVYKVSRAMVGNSLADQLNYPKNSVPFVMLTFRMVERYKRLLNRVLPRRMQHQLRFSEILDVSEFDPEGLNYRLPSHVHAEKSEKW